MNDTRRHNIFGVDITGSPENLNKTIIALNAYAAVVATLRELIIYMSEMHFDDSQIEDHSETCVYCELIREAESVLKQTNIPT